MILNEVNANRKSLSLMSLNSWKLRTKSHCSRQKFTVQSCNKSPGSLVKFYLQLALSQLPLMVLKAEMQSQETEPSNFCSSHLIQAEEDIQSGKFEAFLSHHSV